MCQHTHTYMYIFILIVGIYFYKRKRYPPGEYPMYVPLYLTMFCLTGLLVLGSKCIFVCILKYILVANFENHILIF